MLSLLLTAAALPSQASWASEAAGRVAVDARFTAAASEFDVSRAHTKVPGDHVRARGHAKMVSKVNAHLSASDFRVRACENFTVTELVDLQRFLHSHRDPAFEAVYQAS